MSKSKALILLLIGFVFHPLLAKAQAKGYIASTGTYVDSSCVGLNYEIMRSWEVVISRVNSQIENCANHYELPQLRAAMDFLSQARFYCAAPNEKVEAGGYVLRTLNLDPAADWMGWAPYSVIEGGNNPLGVDWEIPAESKRVIIFNINKMSGGREVGYRPAAVAYSLSGPEGFANTIYHEVMHYMTRIGHHNWQQFNPNLKADPVYGMTEMCFPSVDARLISEACEIVVKTTLNGENSFPAVSDAEARRACSKDWMARQKYTTFIREGV